MSEMTTIALRYLEHAVYKAVVEIPTEEYLAEDFSLDEWLSEQDDGWPNGDCTDVTLLEVIDSWEVSE